jgi:tRNA1Val (adenine37-N6)-methyltransferase
MAAQRCPLAQVLGIDIDAPSVEEARENAIASPFADRVEFRVDDIRRFAVEQSERFDFVLCNPPYYTEDTLPPDARRSMARNSAHLSFAELVQSVCRVMSDDAKFAVVLPMQVRDMFVGEALQGGLHICRECHVKTTSQKTPKRVLLEFINRADSILEKTAIVLQDKTGSRSKEYASLCEDFYL